MKIRDVAYAPVLALAMGMMLARLLLMARLLPVSDFAVYSLGLLVSTSFCMLGCLGLQSLLQRELPMQIVRGQERAGAILSTQCIVVAVACAAILALPAGLWGARGDGAPALVVLVGLLHGLSQQVFLVASVESRSRGATMRFAQENIARAIGVTTAGVFVVTFGGDGNAALAAEAVISIATALVLWRGHVAVAQTRWTDALALAMRRLPRIAWKEAFALLAIMSLSFVVVNADRWIAAQVFTQDGFAQYSFAWIVLMVAQSTQVVINASLFPMLAQRFAQDGGSAAFELARRASLSVAVLGALLAIPAWAVLNAATHWWFPDYEPALAVLPIFLIVAVLRMSEFWSSYLIISGHETRLFRINLALIVVGSLIWWLYARPGENGIEFVDVAVFPALLASLSYATISSAAWRVARQ